MRFGAQYWEFAWAGGTEAIAPRLAESAAILDEAGAETLWLMDHFFQMDSVRPVDDPMLEGYTTLGFLAAHTRSARLGLLVTGVMYRHPGVLAKIVSTLDVLSGGRATLGIGASWYEREHVGLGVPFPPLRERFERLEETLEICRRMWSDDDGPFEGRHHHLAETIDRPPPLSRPRPPVLVGGSGETRTFPLVARYADACNLFAALGPDAIAAKLTALSEACEAVGRDPAEIRKTVLAPVLDDEALPGVVDLMRPLVALGIDTVYLEVTGDPVAFAERVAGEIGPRLAEL